MIKKTWVNILFFCTIAFCCSAQTEGYKFYANLNSIAAPGFYNIEVTPELSAHLKTDYSDIRVINKEGKWIPHILHIAEDVNNAASKNINIEILKKSNAENRTELVLKNSDHFLSSLDIYIRNTEASRIAKLSGSDDLANWFVIKDSANLKPNAVSENGKSSYSIDFPKCNYKFYKMVVNNRGNDPVNILEVKYTAENNLLRAQKNILTPACSLQKMDSNKISYLKIEQQQSFHFDKFKLFISGSKYFFRKVDMYLPTSDKSSFSNPGVFFQSFYVSNNSALEFNIILTNAKTFYLLIQNEDNLPLQIDSLQTFFSAKHITTYLENGEGYKILVGNANATQPYYDLNNANIKPTDSSRNLSYGKIIPVDNNNVSTIVSKKSNKWVIWLAITGVLLVLIFFTKRMLNDLDKKKSENN